MGRKKKVRPEKKCPRCGTKHTKPGTFCSRTCANVREHSEEDKQNKAESVARYYKTEAAEVHRWKLTHIGKALQTSRRPDGTYEMPTEDDMESPLPPTEYEDELLNRKHGRDIWFDVD